MLVEGLNISVHEHDLYIGDSYQIQVNLISDQEDKTVLFQSDHPEIASVDENGVVQGINRGQAIITISNPAGGYSDKVVINVKKKLIISNTLPHYTLDDRYLSDIEKSTRDATSIFGTAGYGKNIKRKIDYSVSAGTWKRTNYHENQR